MEPSIEKYWPDALSLLKESLTDAAFDSMIKKLEPVHFEDETVYFKTENATYKSIIDKRYLVEIRRALQISADKQLDVKIVTSDELVKTRIKAEEAKIEETGHKSNLNPKYVFDTFVAGNSNAMAYAMATSVADDPGRNSYNPLFLYGGVGLGKTHLMHSIGNKILSTNPSFKVLYCSAETFVNEFISSLAGGRNKNIEFREKYRAIDVLLIDDIQFLFEKERSQEEFFHTFNTLYNASKQIVISSDQPPKELKTLEDRISSRCSWGLVVDVKLPDFETRTAILEKKAQLENIVIPNDITKYIAKSIASNIRDLEGAFNMVLAYARLSNTKLTLDLAEKAISDLISENTKPKLSIEYIQDVVASHYGVTPDDLRSKRRTAKVTFPRHVAMYLSRKLIANISLSDVGGKFGGRDHSTVIHGCDTITYELEKNEELRKTVLDLEKKILP